MKWMTKYFIMIQGIVRTHSAFGQRPKNSQQNDLLGNRSKNSKKPERLGLEKLSIEKLID